MSVNSVNGLGTSMYTNYEKEQNAKAAEKKSEAKSAEEGVVFEKATGSDSKATYSINKMSSEDRAALVQQLKADQQSRQESLINIVKQMMNGQAKSYSMATGNDSIWRFLSSGNFTVDAATKSQAMQDISEDGYWGVKQTSQRLFDFASALAGDDVDKMKEMQKAMEKGFKLATAAWGKDLPSISKEKLDAANKLFEDYFATKG